MLFSSIVFLYLFLPLTLALYFAAGVRGRNALLLTASLFFYAWGEMGYVLLMLASIVANWAFGLLIHNARQQGKSGKGTLTAGVMVNLLPLAFFKYGEVPPKNWTSA